MFHPFKGTTVSHYNLTSPCNLISRHDHELSFISIYYVPHIHTQYRPGINVVRDTEEQSNSPFFISLHFRHFIPSHDVRRHFRWGKTLSGKMGHRIAYYYNSMEIPHKQIEITLNK